MRLGRARHRHRAPRIAPLTRAGQGLLLSSLAVYAAGVALGYPELLTVAGGGLLLLAFAVTAVVIRPRLSVERRFHPPRVTVGEPVLGQLEVHNRSRWPALPLVAVDRLRDQPIELGVGVTAPGGSRVVRYPITTARRGRYQVGPITVERRDPLGLLRRGQDHGCTGALWVHPRVHAVSPLPVGVLLDYEGAVTVAAPKGAVTFSSLREYVPGDDPRHMHWKASARTGTLMVKEHVDTSQPRTTVLLDTRAARWTGAAFEHGVELVASIVAGAKRAGRPVELHLAGEDLAAVERAGATGPLDRLAAIEPQPEDDPATLLTLAELAEAGGALVCVTGRVEEAAVARLTAQRRRFAPLVLVRLADGEPLATSWRAGMGVIRAGSAEDAAGAWNRLIVGGRRR
jgi:uncharacterized protein (DUF58 family)